MELLNKEKRDARRTRPPLPLSGAGAADRLRRRRERTVSESKPAVSASRKTPAFYLWEGFADEKKKRTAGAEGH